MTRDPPSISSWHLVGRSPWNERAAMSCQGQPPHGQGVSGLGNGHHSPAASALAEVPWLDDRSSPARGANPAGIVSRLTSSHPHTPLFLQENRSISEEEGQRAPGGSSILPLWWVKTGTFRSSRYGLGQGGWAQG